MLLNRQASKSSKVLGMTGYFILFGKLAIYWKLDSIEVLFNKKLLYDFYGYIRAFAHYLSVEVNF